MEGFPLLLSIQNFNSVINIKNLSKKRFSEGRHLRISKERHFLCSTIFCVKFWKLFEFFILNWKVMKHPGQILKIHKCCKRYIIRNKST